MGGEDYPASEGPFLVLAHHKQGTLPSRRVPGFSAQDDSGAVFHTYSSFSRGLDMFLGAYHLLDIVPKGRDEARFSYGMEWVRHKDRYGDPGFIDPYVSLVAHK